MHLQQKLRLFYITSIFGVLFAVLGFSYNAWRLELTEDNSNVRTAAFEVLLQLSELEQIIYAAHYDQNMVEGSPRKGWVKIGLVVDLSALISPEVNAQSLQLKSLWSDGWSYLQRDEKIVKQLVDKIDDVRSGIKTELSSLQ